MKLMGKLMGTGNSPETGHPYQSKRGQVMVWGPGTARERGTRTDSGDMKRRPVFGRLRVPRFFLPPAGKRARWEGDHILSFLANAGDRENVPIQGT
jgi:hypothetical protein